MLGRFSRRPLVSAELQAIRSATAVSVVGHHYGSEGVRFCTRLKTVTERWPEPASVRADFNVPIMK